MQNVKKKWKLFVSLSKTWLLANQFFSLYCTIYEESTVYTATIFSTNGFL